MRIKRQGLPLTLFLRPEKDGKAVFEFWAKFGNSDRNIHSYTLDYQHTVETVPAEVKRAIEAITPIIAAELIKITNKE